MGKGKTKGAPEVDHVAAAGKYVGDAARLAEHGEYSAAGVAAGIAQAHALIAVAVDGRTSGMKSGIPQASVQIEGAAMAPPAMNARPVFNPYGMRS